MVDCFIRFQESTDSHSLPDRFTFPFDYQPHPLSLIAVKELQHRLRTQAEWKHNFGLDEDQDGMVIGKMFGVLVVQNEQKEIGYLAAFSGKLANGNHHSGFVPPVFDMLVENGFFNKGMEDLIRRTTDIDKLKKVASKSDSQRTEFEQLKRARKQTSIDLQQRLFDNYKFLNIRGEVKSLMDIFSGKKPPSGSGECAAPKLLQYAFLNQLKPICMAEFWWGSSPASEIRKHGSFYPACKGKCEPILSHMLDGIELDLNPISE